jgi:hypothetical protein
VDLIFFIFLKKYIYIYIYLYFFFHFLIVLIAYRDLIKAVRMNGSDFFFFPFFNNISGYKCGR